MRRTPLPESISSAFRVSEAVGAGVTRDRLRANDLSAPFWGARSSGPLDDESRIELLLAVLPDHAFAHGSTAAALHRMPLPRSVAQAAFRSPNIGVPAPHNRIRRKGVVSRSVQIGPAELATVRGIRLTSLARTWCDLSTVLSIARFVAVTDHLIARRSPRCALETLRAAHELSPRAPGAAARRTAFELCDARSESPRESELRVLLVLAGLPTPDANVDIFDGTRFVARVDLLFADQRVIVEYDGDYHRDPAQWSRDQSRRAELESLGYRVTVVTARDFDDPAALVARIRRLLAL